MLLVILLVLCVLVITLARAVPSWSTQIRREREAREIDHARQYRTAILRYYHTYGHYPPSIKVLLQQDGHGVRYLRQEFADPLNLKDGGKFQILHYGQAVTAEIVDQPPAALTTGSKPGTVPGLSSTDAGLSAALPTPPGPTTTAASPDGLAGVSTGLSSGNSAGGGPVIGVVSMNKQPAIHAFNGFDTPNHWQFVYNYAEDPSLRAGGAAVLPGGQLPATSGGGSGGPGQN